MLRKIYNPIQKDYVTFLETSSETADKYTLVEVDLAAGGGVGLHYHKSYDETFECVEGTLGIELEGRTLHLKAGEKVTAKVGEHHRFFNPTKERCRFLCTITPGYRKFEMMLQIGYGLAEAGLTDKHSIPKNKLHLGYMVMLGDTWLTGWRQVFHYFIAYWNRKALEKGVDRDLERFIQY